MTFRRGLLCLAAAGFALAAPLRAQVSLRFGGFTARYSDSLNAQAGTLGLRIAGEGRRSNVLLDAAWSVFDSGSGAGQAWGDFAFDVGSQRNPTVLRFQGLANMPDGGTFTGNATVRLDLGGDRRFLGFAANTEMFGGGLRTLNAEWLYQLGASIRLERYSRSFSVLIDFDYTKVEGISRFVLDQGLTVLWYRGRFTLGAMGGVHSPQINSTELWARGYGSIALAPTVAFEASGGSYPSDLTGYSRGSYLNAGLRVRIGPARSAVSAATGTAVTTGDARVTPAIVVTPEADGQVRIVVSVPNASSLSITGSWNDWTPAPMVAAGGNEWTAVLPIRAGTHRFALIPNGGAWIVPEGVTRLPDDFGGEVGVLVVP